MPVRPIIVSLRQQPALLLLIVLLFVGVAIVVAFTGRGEPPMAVIWLTLVWLVALVAAMGLYAKSSRRDRDR